ncbi:MAG: replication restart helicase PriA [Terriglobales bacterium]
MPPRYASLALPVPVDRAFTYAIPVGMTVAPGMRVLVPWGRRRLVGVVLDLLEEPPAEASASRDGIRPLELALDAEPILDPALLELARWTARYYQAPLGEALRCALPPAADLREDRRLRLTAEGERRATLPDGVTRLLAAGGAGADAVAALLAAAREDGAVSRLLRRFGAAPVRDAIARRWLVLDSAFSPQPDRLEAPTRRAYRLTSHSPALPTRHRPTPQQQAVLDHLAAAGGEMAVAELAPLVSASALVTLRRQGRIAVVAAPVPPPSPEWRPRPRVERLNDEQAAALAAIAAALPAGDRGGASAAPAAAPAVLLLHGVTGSGKTAVYLEAIEAALARGLHALLLLPEIGLTPAVFADFADAFPGQVLILHSGLTAAERARHWHGARRGEARVVIGTRSAIFAPLPRLGLIIVDEEHDAAYKQQESPRYHARDLAVLRGKLAGALVVLGSATPSLESYRNAAEGRYQRLELRQRVEQRPLPRMRCVDMRQEFRERAEGQAKGAGPANRLPELIVSSALAAAIADRLQRREQAIILINRRGYAPVMVCRACGQPIGCRDCSLSLTYHKPGHRLRCHACGYACPPPERCPGCGSDHLYFFGAGSQKIEEALAALFPAARIARLDRDTVQGRRHFSRVLAAFRAGQYDILAGTQMIAKGHDVPGVTLVGVISADAGLAIPEFRAAERTFQLLTQVAGRAGRGEVPGEVILQLLHPDHYAVEAALRADYAAFFRQESRFRRLLFYPPFAALASIRIRHRNYDRALAWTGEVGRYLQTRLAGQAGIRMIGPAPAPIARLKAEHRFQFLLKSARRAPLAGLLAAVRQHAAARYPATAVTVDVDPISLA